MLFLTFICNICLQIMDTLIIFHTRDRKIPKYRKEHHFWFSESIKESFYLKVKKINRNATEHFFVIFYDIKTICLIFFQPETFSIQIQSIFFFCYFYDTSCLYKHPVKGEKMFCTKMNFPALAIFFSYEKHSNSGSLFELEYFFITL